MVVQLHPDQSIGMHGVVAADDVLYLYMSTQNIVLTRGAKIEINPIPGHTCRLFAERRDTETPGWETHITAGFYNPAVDSTGQSAIDLETAQTVFTMPDQDVGLSLFLPAFDEQVLRTATAGPAPTTRPLITTTASAARARDAPRPIEEPIIGLPPKTPPLCATTSRT